MNRKKYLILTAMLSLLCINKTYAACTQEEINDFKSVEDEYIIEPTLNMDNKKYVLKMTRKYPDKYDYLIHAKGTITCKDIDENNTECYPFNPGKYKIEIVGQTNSCNDVFKTLILNLEPYNKFSESPLCNGIEEFVLCQKTYKKELTQEEFESRVNTYKKTNQNQTEEEQNQPPTEIKNKLISYVKENLLTIIIIVVFAILVIITTIITWKSLRKSRRLE